MRVVLLDEKERSVLLRMLRGDDTITDRYDRAARTRALGKLLTARKTGEYVPKAKGEK